jgi:hypothetical protein
MSVEFAAVVCVTHNEPSSLKHLNHPYQTVRGTEMLDRFLRA